MEWQNPETLYLILPLCVAWFVLVLYSRRKQQSAREAFVAQAMWSRMLPDESPFRFWIKHALRIVGIIASLVALAGPQFGTEIEQIVPRGSDLYVLIDVSRSMLADDVAPTRLGRAKADVSALVNRLEGERIGLIAFAGQAVVKCPLTIDYDSFRRALKELDSSSAPRGGTAIGDAIRKALDVFQGKVDRDQAMLLITDGDDQKSYPLEAAATASEHNVTIFTVGLGDSEQGSRIPQKEDAKSFVEYQGEQVWSKMNGNLLGEIALKTSGVYVPAGTKAYDLGELYSSHLQSRHAKDAATQERTRRSEQYQMFLAVAIGSLLIELCISTYRRRPNYLAKPISFIGQSTLSEVPSKNRSAGLVCLIVGLGMAVEGRTLSAIEPRAAVREGLKLYSQEKFESAREKFAAAIEEFDQQKSEHTAVAAFDEACAFHRNGEVEKAREAYLRSGISKDREISIASHFNLGALAAEQAKAQAGEQPETIAPDKRQAILDQLMSAAAAYRHCLELQPEHPTARKNLELIRLWIKYYSDKWREADRQKRRDETNLIQFLQYVIDTQKAMNDTITQLPSNTSPDRFAELKQLQSDLAEEIPTLEEKIDKELRPNPSQNNNNAAPNSDEDAKEIEEGIRMLKNWANTSKEQMLSSARALIRHAPKDSMESQRAAIAELDKIWDAVVPFHPLLAKDLADQTSIVEQLDPYLEKPQPSKEISDENIKPSEKVDATSKPDTDPFQPGATQLVIAEDELKEIVETQERTLRKSILLAPKAEMELKQFENSPPTTPDLSKANTGVPGDPNQPPQEPPVDPEEVKAGYEKAMELAPLAVEQMKNAIDFLRQKSPKNAAESAKEARRILEEIQKAQPKKKQDQNQDQKDQQDQKNKDDQKSDSKDEKDSQSKDPQKPDEKKPEENKSDTNKDKQSEKDQSQSQPKPQVSPDRIEEALRKVREREEEKRDRDREFKAKILGRLPVDKDW